MVVYEGKLNAKGIRVAVVVSRFNSFITERLLEGALDALRRHGAEEGDIEIYRVPGAFEIPLVAKHCARKSRVDGVICLGAVIKGATPHFNYVAAEVSKGIAQTSLEEGKPVAFGIITSDSIEQAIERAGSKSGNKGYEAAVTVVEMVNLLREEHLCEEGKQGN